MTIYPVTENLWGASGESNDRVLTRHGIAQNSLMRSRNPDVRKTSYSELLTRTLQNLGPIEAHFPAYKDLEKRLLAEFQRMFRIPVDEVEDRYDELAWRSEFTSDVFISFANNTQNRADHRGMAAVLYVQSLYPETAWPDFPQIQTDVQLSEVKQASLNAVAKSDEPLVCIGVIEALERVSDFSMVEKLFADHADETVRQAALDFLDECHDR